MQGDVFGIFKAYTTRGKWSFSNRAFDEVEKHGAGNEFERQQDVEDDVDGLILSH